MSHPAIEVSGLSKRYVIEHESRHDNLRDTLHHTARKLWRRVRWGTGFEREEFWALRDISFSIQPGEVVGVIGRNGAGKSTLLKILSRITEPSSGKIAIRGRVASLLEVGTGFHPDLTGRENIFLNGAILGMSRAEIRAKFDEIVAFAEIERFLDTPVKRYSSGMYVRLAFAVAAHLEPEILIVDEVLAVGDAQFQKKCLGKMQDVARGQGRTVLFVSHNLTAVQMLCTRGLCLAGGHLVFDGTADEAALRYQQPSVAASSGPAFTGGDPALRIDHVAHRIEGDRPGLDVDLTVRSREARTVSVEFVLQDRNGYPLAFSGPGTLGSSGLTSLRAGEQTLRRTIDTSRLATGSYRLTAKLVHPMVQKFAEQEYPEAVGIERIPRPPAIRNLELSWNAGAVEVDHWER